MYSVKVEKECGCFKRSGMKVQQSFNNKEEALIEAKEMAEEMNEAFCKKHNFNVAENGNEMLIQVTANKQ